VIAASVAGADSHIETAMLDAVTLGWVDTMLTELYAMPSEDPLTGLAPLAYLVSRIDETYSEATISGVHAADTHAVVLVSTRRSGAGLSRETQMIWIQSALRTAFPGGETLARIGPHTACALVSRDPARLRESLRRLAIELRTAEQTSRIGPSQMWVESLPRSQRQIGELLRERAS
jgi:hypothetical protein